MKASEARKLIEERGYNSVIGDIQRCAANGFNSIRFNLDLDSTIVSHLKQDGYNIEDDPFSGVTIKW